MTRLGPPPAPHVFAFCGRDQHGRMRFVRLNDWAAVVVADSWFWGRS